MSRLSSHLRSTLLRPLLHHYYNHTHKHALHSLTSALSSTSQKLTKSFFPSSPSPSPSLSSSLTSPLSFSSLAVPTAFSLFSPHQSRSYSTDPEKGGSNLVEVKTEALLVEALKKAQDESSPAVFYFTAEWCGPCRLLWPELKKLSESLPGVQFYKIDIDGLGNGATLGNLNIQAVPTLHFFKHGKKANEVVGVDLKKMKDISSSLYKTD